MRPLPSSLLALSCACAATLVAACGGDVFSSDRDGLGDAGSESGGTSSGAGGASASGGSGAGGRSGGTGGRAAAGGGIAAGGGPSPGGSVGAGGVTSSGGAVSTGGRPGAGGSVATGGASGSGGGTGSGGSSAVCPSSVPNGDCSQEQEGLQCVYGECCPTYAMCSSGQWQIAIAGCAVPTCPDEIPTNGTSCACMDGLSCDYGSCATSAGYVNASCENEHWALGDRACSDPCNDVQCLPGTMCLATYQASTNQWGYDCVVPFCSGGNDRCQCIYDLCTGKGGVCRELASGGVQCTTP